MLSRYSPVRMEAKRRALDEIAARQCKAGQRKADEKRKEETGWREQAAEVCQSATDPIYLREEPRAEFRRGYHASIPLAKPTIAVMGD
jgi:hypothetical protein